MPWVGRRFAAASGGLLLAKLVATAAVALTAILAARTLGPSGRGVLAIEATVAGLTTLAIALGTTVSCRVLLVAEDTTVTLADYIGLALFLTTANGLVTMLVGAIVLPIAGVDGSLSATLPLGVFGASLLASVSATNALYALGLFGRAGAMEATGAVVALALTAAASAAGSTNVWIFLGALSIGGCVTVTGNVMCLATVGRRRVPHYERASWRRLVRTGVPAMGLSLTQSAAFRFDRYLIGLYLNPVAVGLYAVAAAGTEFLRVLPTSIGQVLLHRVAAFRAGAGASEAVYRVGMLATAIPVIILVFSGHWVIITTFGDAYQGSVGSFRILLLGEIAVASFLLDSSVLVGRGDVRWASLSATGGVVVVTVLDLLLIGSYGSVGASWASVVGYAVMAIVCRFYVTRAPADGGRTSVPPRADISTPL